jgi:CheY-like chemotaxis protein
MMTNTPILAAEDEESDAMILRLAFERAGLANPLVVVRDGQEAVDYLLGTGAYAAKEKHALPGLLLLDLKMPRMSGFDVLEWLHDRPEFSHLPVVVLSSSPDQLDIHRAKQCGAREYFVKPHSLKELVVILHSVRSRWLSDAGVTPAEKRD